MKHKKSQFGKQYRPMTEAEMKEREQRFAPVKAKVWRCVKPILCDNDLLSRSDPEASCVLVRVKDQRFLMSAGHVFLDRSARFRVPNHMGTLVPLTPIQIFNTSNPDEKSDDEFDVAVVPLGPEIAKLFDITDFLSVDDIDSDEAATPGNTYAAFGYPTALTRRTDDGRHVRFNATTIRTRVKGDTYKSLKLHGNTHFIVEFDRLKMAKPDGRPATPPKPHGMSGGGLFRVDTNEAKLAGILSEWRDHKKVMVATHIAFCLALIKSQYPELAAAIPATRTVLVHHSKSILL